MSREKKKAESASSTTPAQVETRLDKDEVETRLDEDKVETMVDKDKVETRVDKVETRVDKDKAERRREAAKPAMQKRRANQHPKKKRGVRDKRMRCYYREKRQKGIICCRPGGRRQFKLKCYFSPRTVLIPLKGHSKGLLGGSRVRSMLREKGLRSCLRVSLNCLTNKRNRS